MSKISLERGGYIHREDNPHIVEPEDRDNVFKGNSELTTIVLDFVIEDTVDVSFVSSWFEQIEYRKYLRAKIIQSTNPTVSEQLKNMDVNEIYSTPLFFARGTQKTVQVQNIDIFEDAIGDKTKLEKHNLEFTEDGKRQYKIYYRKTFSISNSFDNLDYFFFVYLDLKSLANDFGIDPPEDLLGDLIHIPVIQNGQLSSATNIQDFRAFEQIEKAQFNLSIIENEFFSKKNVFSIYGQEDLFERRVPYFSDLFLAIGKDGSAKFSFAFDSYGFVLRNSVFGKLLFNEDLEVRKEYLLNSEILLLKIFRRRVKNKISLNKLGSPVHGNEIFESNEPDQLLVNVRERSGIVDKINSRNVFFEELPITVSDGIRFFTCHDRQSRFLSDGIYRYGVEISVLDGSTELMKKYLNEINSARQSLEKYYSESKYDQNSNLFEKKFANTIIEQYPDKNLAPWILPVVQFFDIVNKLTGILEEPKKEKNLGQRVRKPDRNFRAPTKKHFNVEDFLGKNEGNFDIKYGNFALVKTILESIHPRTGNPANVAKFIKIVDMIAKNVERSIGESVGVEKIGLDEKSSNRNFGGKKKVATIVKWFDNVVYDSNIPREAGIDYFENPNKKSKKEQNEGIKQVTEEEYEERTKLETLKYFKDIDSNSDIIIDNKNFGTIGQSSREQQYAFLSPSQIKTASEVINFLDDADIGKNFNFEDLEVNLVSNSKKDVTKLKNQIIKNILNESAEIVTDFKKAKMAETDKKQDCVITTKIDPHINPFQSFKKPSTKDAEEIVKEEIVDKMFKQIIRNRLSKRTTRPISTRDGSIKVTLSEIEVSRQLDSGIVGALKEEGEQKELISRFLNKNKSSDVSMLPNQIKALILSKTSSGGNAKGPVLKSNLNYELINKVDILTGFEESDTKVSDLMIKKPIWKQLTLDLFASPPSRVSLCRMRKYSNDELGIQERSDINVPVYDEYFVIVFREEKNPERPAKPERLPSFNNNRPRPERPES